MLKSIHLLNFQSHEESNLLFHRGVNIIVGASDSGKTAIIRALRWAAWNKPSGNSICSNWGGETNVKLETEDGVVIRTKGKSDSYVLNSLSGKHLEFKAFGTSVPEEINSVLNLNEINLQNQLDTPFLLSETPGAVATHFNKIARLDKIDIGLQNINSTIRELTSDIKYKTEDLTTLETQLKGYEFLEKFEIEVEVLEGLEKRLISLINSTNKLKALVEVYDPLIEEIEDFSTLLQFEKPLDQIFKWQDEIEDIGDTGSELNFTVKQILKVEEEIIEQQELITFEIDINALLTLYDKRNTLIEPKKRLFKALSSLNSIEDQLTIAQSKHTALNEKLKLIKICPFCGNKIKN